MNRKDLELLARTIRESKTDGQFLDGDAARNFIAWRFAEAIRGTNTNFNAEKFLKACGVKS